MHYRPMSTSPSQLLTTTEVADELGVPARTLDQWRYLGRGPAYIKVGHHVRYERADVDAWKLGQRVAPSTKAS